MRLIIWVVIGFCLLVGVSHAGTLSSYPQTTTLQNADSIPAIIYSGDTNANINWSDLKNIMSSGLNWTDIKVVGTKYGDHSGINWQSFGA